MANLVIGYQVLHDALKELSDMNRPDWKKTLRSAVRDPMAKVQKQARANIASISPGNKKEHRTYKRDIVTAGFASRSIAMSVIVKPEKGYALALLGVKPEAFYAISFFELGTSKIQRKPWLVPAFEASQDTAIKDIGDAMRKRIEAIAKKRYQQSLK